jgi:hypothetical protein
MYRTWLIGVQAILPRRARCRCRLRRVVQRLSRHGTKIRRERVWNSQNGRREYQHYLDSSGRWSGGINLYCAHHPVSGSTGMQFFLQVRLHVVIRSRVFRYRCGLSKAMLIDFGPLSRPSRHMYTVVFEARVVLDSLPLTCKKCVLSADPLHRWLCGNTR